MQRRREKERLVADRNRKKSKMRGWLVKREIEIESGDIVNENGSDGFTLGTPVSIQERSFSMMFNGEVSWMIRFW